jgi:hypothetical protein
LSVTSGEAEVVAQKSVASGIVSLILCGTTTYSLGLDRRAWVALKFKSLRNWKVGKSYYYKVIFHYSRPFVPGTYEDSPQIEIESGAIFVSAFFTESASQ